MRWNHAAVDPRPPLVATATAASRTVGATAALATRVALERGALAAGGDALGAAPATVGPMEQLLAGDLGAAPAALLADVALLVERGAVSPPRRPALLQPYGAPECKQAHLAAAVVAGHDLRARVGRVRPAELRVAAVADVARVRAAARLQRLDDHVLAAARLGALAVEVLHARQLRGAPGKQIVTKVVSFVVFFF